MTITYGGQLPISVLNPGLALSVTGLGQEVAKLQAEISALDVAVVAKLKVTAQFPPALPQYAGVIASSLSVPELTARMNPTNWVTMGASISTDIAAQLGLIEAQLAVMVPLVGKILLGLDSGGISGWSYTGPTSGFGQTLNTAVQPGFSGVTPTENVSGIVIATEDSAAWGALAEGIRIHVEQATSAVRKLMAYGPRTGASWNFGTAALSERLRLFLAQLRGAKLQLEANAQLALGLNLPDPSLIVNGGLDVVARLGISGLLDNLVNVQTDLGAVISGLNAKITATLNLAASLTTQLAFGGLSFWSYSGPANELGAALASELGGGLPGGTGIGAPLYGLALAGKVPAMTQLGNIIKTAA